MYKLNIFSRYKQELGDIACRLSPCEGVAFVDVACRRLFACIIKTTHPYWFSSLRLLDSAALKAFLVRCELLHLVSALVRMMSWVLLLESLLVVLLLPFLLCTCTLFAVQECILRFSLRIGVVEDVPPNVLLSGVYCYGMGAELASLVWLKC